MPAKTTGSVMVKPVFLNPNQNPITAAVSVWRNVYKPASVAFVHLS